MFALGLALPVTIVLVLTRWRFVVVFALLSAGASYAQNYTSQSYQDDNQWSGTGDYYPAAGTSSSVSFAPGVTFTLINNGNVTVSNIIMRTRTSVSPTWVNRSAVSIVSGSSADFLPASVGVAFNLRYGPQTAYSTSEAEIWRGSPDAVGSNLLVKWFGSVNFSGTWSGSTSVNYNWKNTTGPFSIVNNDTRTVPIFYVAPLPTPTPTPSPTPVPPPPGKMTEAQFQALAASYGYAVGGTAFDSSKVPSGTRGKVHIYCDANGDGTMEEIATVDTDQYGNFFAGFDGSQYNGKAYKMTVDLSATVEGQAVTFERGTSLGGGAFPDKLSGPVPSPTPNTAPPRQSSISALGSLTTVDSSGNVRNVPQYTVTSSTTSGTSATSAVITPSGSSIAFGSATVANTSDLAQRQDVRALQSDVRQGFASVADAVSRISPGNLTANVTVTLNGTFGNGTAGNSSSSPTPSPTPSDPLQGAVSVSQGVFSNDGSVIGDSSGNFTAPGSPGLSLQVTAFGHTVDLDPTHNSLVYSVMGWIRALLYALISFLIASFLYARIMQLVRDMGAVASEADMARAAFALQSSEKGADPYASIPFASGPVMVANVVRRLPIIGGLMWLAAGQIRKVAFLAALGVFAGLVGGQFLTPGGLVGWFFGGRGIVQTVSAIVSQGSPSITFAVWLADKFVPLDLLLVGASIGISAEVVCFGVLILWRAWCNPSMS